MHDPLENPRAAWRLHYDHRSRMGRYGAFLARMFGLRTSGDRYLSDLRSAVFPGKGGAA